MKLRLEENSVRFRLNEEELERLVTRGRVESATEIYSRDSYQAEGRFVYGIARAGDEEAETCIIQPSYILLVLHADSIAALRENPKDAVFVKREIQRGGGIVHRFMAYVEIDRPMKHRKRPEAWLEETES